MKIINSQAEFNRLVQNLVFSYRGDVTLTFDLIASNIEVRILGSLICESISVQDLYVNDDLISHGAVEVAGELQGRYVEVLSSIRASHVDVCDLRVVEGSFDALEIHAVNIFVWSSIKSVSLRTGTLNVGEVKGGVAVYCRTATVRGPVVAGFWQGQDLDCKSLTADTVILSGKFQCDIDDVECPELKVFWARTPTGPENPRKGGRK